MKNVARDERPVIIVTSADDAEVLDWMSDNWYRMKERGSVKAEQLMRAAKKAIKEADDVKGAIRNLEAAGFKVRRPTEFERRMRRALDS